MSTTQKSVCRPYIFLVSQTLSFTRSTCLVVCSWSSYMLRSASSLYIDWSCILDSPCKRIRWATHCWYTMMTGHLWTTYKAVEKRVSLSNWVGIPCLFLFWRVENCSFPCIPIVNVPACILWWTLKRTRW